MNCLDFTAKERDDCRNAITELDDALARIRGNLIRADSMLLDIRISLSDVLNPPYKAKGE